MASKVVLSKEEIENIINLHMETGNYSEISRRTGYSQVIVKRIIQENTGKCNQDISYKDINYSEFYNLLYHYMQQRGKNND